MQACRDGRDKLVLGGLTPAWVLELVRKEVDMGKTDASSLLERYVDAVVRARTLRRDSKSPAVAQAFNRLLSGLGQSQATFARKLGANL